MDVHEWHSNTEFIPTNKKMAGGGKSMDKKNNWHFNRLSIVCYLRDKMIRCKNMKTTAPQLLNTGDSIINKTVNYDKLTSLEKQIKEYVPGFEEFIKLKGYNLFD